MFLYRVECAQCHGLIWHQQFAIILRIHFFSMWQRCERLLLFDRVNNHSHVIDDQLLLAYDQTSK